MIVFMRIEWCRWIRRGSCFNDLYGLIVRIPILVFIRCNKRWRTRLRIRQDLIRGVRILKSHSGSLMRCIIFVGPGAGTLLGKEIKLMITRG